MAWQYTWLKAGWEEDMTDDEKEIKRGGQEDSETGKWDTERELS